MSTNPLGMTATEILNIPFSTPERLFTQTDLKSQIRRLRRKWHPDVSSFKDTDSVFDHISKLYKIAEEKLTSGTWKGTAKIHFTNNAGKTYRFAYRTMHEIELGKLYVAKNLIMYVIDKKYEDLFDNGIRQIKSIKYPPELKKEFTQWFPKIKFADKTADIGLVAILEKPSGSVLLQDLIDYMPDEHIDPLHVAWIMSAMYNIVTFLDHTGLCHNSIIPNTIFVDPVNHATYLLGGWWYTTKVNEKLKAIPSALVKTLPKEVFNSKIAITSYDRKAVKGIGIACLGDPSMIGMKLLARKDVPKPMLNWLRAPSGTNAIDEYSGWYKTLETCFGKRKFVKFEIDVDDIY